MRRAEVFVHGVLAGHLEETGDTGWRFVYVLGYDGAPVSLTMPVRQEAYRFDTFPPFFDGVLPEGMMLEGLLRAAKLDRGDRFGQLVAVGGDLVGAVQVRDAS
jgi:serine/threonine-protein kinase HipA